MGGLRRLSFRTCTNAKLSALKRSGVIDPGLESDRLQTECSRPHSSLGEMEVSPHKEGEKTSNPVLDGILNSERACTMQYFCF